VPRDDGARLQRFDHIERGDPLLSGISIRLTEVDMNIVVRNVARHYQTDRRDMEASRIPGISMARWKTHEFLTFKLKDAASELFCNRKHRVDLPRESGFPICFKRGR
jgi:hypothetical protein